MQRSFRNYLFVRDTSKNLIGRPFKIYIYQINEPISFKEDSIIEMSTDNIIKIQFIYKLLDNFWFHVRTNYPDLSTKALKVLIPFPTNNLCE